MRIGQSVDIHPIVPGRKLILAGVEIPWDYGLAGHSDADVLTHAVAESILGALALGDLGHHFPDTDPRYKGIRSILLLEHVCRLMEEKGYRIGNVDALVLAEQPKMAPYIQVMRENLASALHTSLDNISVKATRGERLGFVGRKEGMMATAVCLLEKT